MIHSLSTTEVPSADATAWARFRAYWLGLTVSTIGDSFTLVALPIAALVLGRRWQRDPQFGRYSVGVRVLGWVSLGWLSTIVLGVALRPLTGVPWWRFLPLGLVERGLALTEVAAVVVLGLWARHAARVAPREAAMIGA